MPIKHTPKQSAYTLRFIVFWVALLGSAYYFFWPYFGASGYPDAWSAPRLMVGDIGGCPDLTGDFDVVDSDVWAIFTGYSSSREIPHFARVAQSGNGDELRITLMPNADTLAQLRGGLGVWTHDVNELVLKRGRHYYCNGRWLRLKASDSAAVSRNRAGNLIVNADRFSTSTLKVGVMESEPYAVKSSRWRQLYVRDAHDVAELERAKGFEIRRIAQAEAGVVQAQILNFNGKDLCMRTWDSASTAPNERHANASMIGGLSADETHCSAPWQRLRYPGMLHFNLQTSRPYRIAWRNVGANESELTAVDVHPLDLVSNAIPVQNFPAAPITW